jgi:hypothetical protein
MGQVATSRKAVRDLVKKDLTHLVNDGYTEAADRGIPAGEWPLHTNRSANHVLRGHP